jgi:cytochrome c-type biogenesis protein CcmH/NrfF
VNALSVCNCRCYHEQTFTLVVLASVQKIFCMTSQETTDDREFASPNHNEPKFLLLRQQVRLLTCVVPWVSHSDDNVVTLESL